MKNYLAIKGWKASEIIMAVYVIAVLAGMPLFVTDAYYHINVDKYYYYCGACALLIPALIMKLRERPSIKGFLENLSLGEKALLIYWAIAGLSTLLSDYLYEAFWGNEGRFSGFCLMTIYMLAYFIISRCYRPHPICMYACMAAACLAFAFGVTDYLSMDIFHFKENMRQEQVHQFISTVGNINFYASYAGMIAGAAAAIYGTWTKKRGAVLWFFLMTASFIGVVIGNSDSAYLGLGALFGFLPLYLFKDRQGIRRYFMMLSSLLLALSFYKVLAICFRDTVMQPDGVNRVVVGMNAFFVVCVLFWCATGVIYAVDYRLHREKEELGEKAKKIWMIFLLIAAVGLGAILIDANLLGHGNRYGSLGNMLVFNDHWGTNRGFAWRKAMEHYMEFPLLKKIFGYGPETFGIISHFQDLQESKAFSGELFDNTHNEYLQFLVTIGPVATAAYMVFLALSVRDMLRVHCSPYIMGMGFGVLCYSVQAVVNLNQPTSTPFMWTFLSMGIAEYRRYTLKKEEEPIRNGEEI